MPNNDIEHHIAQWTAENKPVGEKLGYPECCVKEFCEQPPAIMQTSKPSKNDQRRYKAAHVNGKFSGFIPCSDHAKKIVLGIIKLADLVDNTKRDDKFPPFPFA